MAALVSTLPGYSWKILGVMATTSSLLTFRNITTSQALMREKIKKPKFIPREVSGFEVFVKEMCKLDFVNNRTHKKKYEEYCKRWGFMMDKEKQPYADKAASINHLKYLNQLRLSRKKNKKT